jgi:hypothetical protein
MELYNAVKQFGSIAAAAKELGIPKTTFRRKLLKEKQEYLSSTNPLEVIEHKAETEVRHFIISSAQDKTKIHEDFWNNLNAYAEFLDADILIGPFTYSFKLFKDPNTTSNEVWYDERIEDYIVYDRVALGENILFCAEMNTMPTAVQPLSGLESYTKDKWGIFPHAKVQLKSIATMKHTVSKQIMTTGAITLPNYVRKKAGIKAEFHHQIAALVVSVAPDGAFFCRHIHATDLKDGSFYDLDRYVSNGVVEEGHRPEVLVHGDIHIEKIDPDVYRSTWSKYTNSLQKTLNPKRRVFHDLLDFSARNHHNIYDHHFRFASYHNSADNVKNDFKSACEFLNTIAEFDCEDYVIQSNHDNALIKWLKCDTAKYDPENYEFWLECELEYIRSLKSNDDVFLFEKVMRNLGVRESNLHFIPEDQSLEILDTELAIHGHYGANGARGSASAFSKMGPKSITGHTHSPSITDGHMCVGTNSKLDMGYNRGLSSWAHTNAILYSNGSRALITMSNGRWFD